MSVQERKDWERTQRRARIVDAAERLFLERGYAATPLPAVARAAGYHRRNLYFYFADKEALFLAVVERALERLHAQLAAVGDLRHPAPDDLERFARAFFAFAMDRPRELDLIMRYETAHYVYDPAGRPPDTDPTRAACQRLSDRMAAMVQAVLDAGQQNGRLRTDLPPRPLMLVLWGQMLGVVQVLRMREKGFRRTFGIDRQALFERFLLMVDQALRPAVTTPVGPAHPPGSTGP